MTDPHTGPQVVWHSWGPEALQLARETGKPILLAIGYETCHWCQVMTRESFEDPATAELMNQLFINIRIDRDERPDIDQMCQLAHRLLTHSSGGWPLTAFLTPDEALPFFAGTYFPRVAGRGMPAFVDVLQRVAQYYQTQQTAIRAQNQTLLQALQDLETGEASAPAPLDVTALLAARTQLQTLFDREQGGWGSAPKFPRPAAVIRLLRQWQATAHESQVDLQALYMASLSLQRMADSALQDPVAGGFSSYCLDQAWQTPSLEKTLPDNALLLSAYAAATVATGDPCYAQVVTATARFVLRDLQSPAGGFYSAVTRELRVSPLQPVSSDNAGLDTKVLTGSNALAIRALTDAALALGQDELADAALRTLAFIHQHLWRDGRLLAVYDRGQAYQPAFLDDYVLLIDAILTVQTLRFDSSQLQWACQLMDVVLARFTDTTRGGFYSCADDQPLFLLRSRSFSDQRLPAGNAMAAQVLLRLGHLLGQQRYLQAAQNTLQAGMAQALAQPISHLSLLLALDEFVRPPVFIIIRGTPSAMREWQTALSKLYAPRVLVLCIDSREPSLPAALAACQPQGERVAYVRDSQGLSAPLTALALLLDALRAA
jgi:uncharacterized protein YyaL (SSP411 family)